MFHILHLSWQEPTGVVCPTSYCFCHSKHNAKEPPTSTSKSFFFLQISTTSGFHSLVFHLEVVTPRARVEGHDGEFHVVRGSTISLTCIVDEAPTPPQ